ncbi:MAG: hypothetical protein ACYDB7_12000 [Mycobacteriales bacterium]
MALALGEELAATPASHRRYLTELAAELALRDPDGSRLRRVEDPHALAREAAERAVDTAAIWQQHLGAFYDVDGVRTLLGRSGRPVSKQAVSQRRGLLALRTGSGRVVYPSLQFCDGVPLRGLEQVLDALPEQLVSRWTVASWLVSTQPDLGGDRPVDVLAARQVDAVVAAARAWAAALAL